MLLLNSTSPASILFPVTITATVYDSSGILRLLPPPTRHSVEHTHTLVRHSMWKHQPIGQGEPFHCVALFQDLKHHSQQHSFFLLLLQPCCINPPPPPPPTPPKIRTVTVLQAHKWFSVQVNTDYNDLGSLPLPLCPCASNQASIKSWFHTNIRATLSQTRATGSERVHMKNAGALTMLFTLYHTNQSHAVHTLHCF